MRRVTFLKALRRRPLWPVLAFAYVLLAQSILGNAAASAHAFAMAQHEALGLGVLCLENGKMAVADPARTAPQEQMPAGDCLACKIACAAAIGMPVLPQPDMVALFTIHPDVSLVPSSRTDDILARLVLFPSDLPSRAPPADLI